MTDKEKANNYELDCIADVHKDDVCTIPCAYSAQKLEQAYLDGLAEGRKEDKPKWHDLRKNPDDLPKKSGDYFCKLKSNRLYTFEIYYTDSLFYKSRWNELDIIAWCELPKFKE